METAGAPASLLFPTQLQGVPNCREQTAHARPGGVIALFAMIGQHLRLQLNAMPATNLFSESLKPQAVIVRRCRHL